MYKTYDQIVAEMQADMVASGSLATDWNDGSQIQTMVQVTSRALYTQWYMLELLVELFFVSSSEGPFLDLRVNERGVYREEGTAATGPIDFNRTSASPIATDIPAGSTLATMDGTLQFTTNADCSLASGWTTGIVDITCTTVGAAANLAAGTQLQIVGPTPPGIQTIVVGAGGLTGGVDVESDDALRARYLFTIQNPVDGGTSADYVVWAEEVTGVTNVVPVPLARGNGTVDVVVAANGIPSADLIQQVQDVFNTNRPIGADAQAKAPTANTIDVTGTITPATGYTFAALLPLVTQSVTNYINSVPIGGVVRWAAIIDAIMSVQGVLDCTLSAPTGNTVLSQEQLAVPGTLDFTEAA